MKIISFMNQKGGVGKTTTTFHFASYQANKGKKVLCVDLDPQGSLSFCMGADTDGKNTIYELLMGEATFEETVQKGNYGDIIPSDTTLGILSGNIERADDKLNLLKKRLAGKLENYDYVLIDCPPAMTLFNLNALSISNNVVIVTQAEALSLLGLPQVFDLINNSDRFYNKKINVAGILITMYNGALKISRAMRDKIKNVVEKFDIFSYNTLVKKLTAINEATVNQKSVFDYAPKTQASDLYKMACEEIENSLK